MKEKKGRKSFEYSEPPTQKVPEVPQMALSKFPLVARFQRARWSPSRCKIHNLEVGGEVMLSKFDRNNITTSVERIEEAYEQTRRYHVYQRENGILVTRSK